jgi:hypothetical protein
VQTPVCKPCSNGELIRFALQFTARKKSREEAAAEGHRGRHHAETGRDEFMII